MKDSPRSPIVIASNTFVAHERAIVRVCLEFFMQPWCSGLFCVDLVWDNDHASRVVNGVTAQKYMNPENNLRARLMECIDLRWIAENYDAFLRVALRDMKTFGRGAIAVDVTNPLVGGGHAIIYWPEAYIQKYGDEAMCRLVATYDPEEELVVMLLKPGNRINSYRVRSATL